MTKLLIITIILLALAVTITPIKAWNVPTLRGGIYTEQGIVSFYAVTHYNGFVIGLDHGLPFGSVHTRNYCVGSCDE